MQKMLGKAYPYVINVCDLEEINEIRIRIGQKILLKTMYGTFNVPFVADTEYINSVIDAVTNNSRYAYENTISVGYIDYLYGIRIGLVGEGWVKDGKTIFRNFYSLCIRIPHEIENFNEFPQEIIENFDNTLVVAPPGGGKTTLIRSMSKKLSEKNDLLIIDEREEICGKNLIYGCGKRSDIIQGVPKQFVFERAIRTMAPEIVVCDELFGAKDFLAVKTLILSGIKVLATYHSDNHIPTVLQQLFTNVIYLSSKPHPGSIKSIIFGKQDFCEEQ